MRTSITRTEGMSRALFLDPSERWEREIYTKQANIESKSPTQSNLVVVPLVTQDWTQILHTIKEVRDMLAHRKEEESREEKKRHRGKGTMPHLQALRVQGGGKRWGPRATSGDNSKWEGNPNIITCGNLHSQGTIACSLLFCVTKPTRNNIHFCFLGTRPNEDICKPQARPRPLSRNPKIHRLHPMGQVSKYARNQMHP